MKTTNIRNKPNESFRFMPSGQEMDQTYSIAPGADEVDQNIAFRVE